MILILKVLKNILTLKVLKNFLRRVIFEFKIRRRLPRFHSGSGQRMFWKISIERSVRYNEMKGAIQSGCAYMVIRQSDPGLVTKSHIIWGYNLKNKCFYNTGKRWSDGSFDPVC